MLSPFALKPLYVVLTWFELPRGSSSTACPMCSEQNWSQFENDMWRLEHWIQSTEAKLSVQPTVPPSKIEQLEDVIQEHRVRNRNPSAFFHHLSASNDAICPSFVSQYGCNSYRTIQINVRRTASRFLFVTHPMVDSNRENLQ